MDSSEKIKDLLVQTAKVAVSGDSDKARTHLLRLLRPLLKTDPGLAHMLREVATSVPPGPKFARSSSAARRAEPAWTSDEQAPADKDSQLDLLRIEDPPRIPHTPIYDVATRRVLEALVQEHNNPEALLDIGLQPTRALILSGPPGVGKTLAARWIAHQLGLPLVVLDLSTVMSRYLGATGANLKKAFKFAANRPCILLLDELDAVAKRRDDQAELGELKRLVTVLLQELDEWPEGKLIIGATNHGHLLDPAVWRRFEARIELPRPNILQLQKLLPELLPAGISIPKVWVQVLPTLLDGTSNSELQQTLSNLRRTAALNPALTPEEVLSPVVESYLANASRAKRKEVAISLEELTDLSARTISAMTGVSRDTMRRTRKTERDMK